MNYADIVADLSWGDTGKGKVTSFLAKDGSYDFVCRWAGGNNAGHTVYLNNKKYKTHLVPSGVFHGIKSIIGPQCVVHPESLMKEIEYLEENGFDTSLLKVSPKAHIVTSKHIDYDKERLALKLGTTSKGIAPCYADKMYRKGLRAEDIFPQKMLWDEDLYGKVLCEGAQGFYLDIDWGNYPYVTSSTTLPYGACSLGFSPKKIRNIWGIAKIYDTRSGKDPMFPADLLNDKDLSLLGEIGSEIGVTTGRRRIVNWMRLDLLISAIRRSGSNKIIINKCDIIEELGTFKLYAEECNLIEFNNISNMKKFIKKKILLSTDAEDVIFSSSKERI